MLPDLSNFKIDEATFLAFMEERSKIEAKKEERARVLHKGLKDLDTLTPYLKDLSLLEADLVYPEELPVYWDLVMVAKLYGEPLSDKNPLIILGEINPFASEIYHYKDYLFCIMNGQGSCPWFSLYEDYQSILNK